MFDEKRKAISLLKESKVYKGSLSRIFVTISKYYKHIGLKKNDAFRLLLDWLQKQKYDMELSVVISDLEKAVDNVYKNNYTFIHDIGVWFYRNEIEFINTFKSKGEKNVGLSLLYLSKIYGNEFYCYHNTLRRLTGISVRHINRIIKKLVAYDFMEISVKSKYKKVIRDKKNMPTKYYSTPNTYKIKVIGDGEIVLTCGDINNIEMINDILE